MRSRHVPAPRSLALLLALCLVAAAAAAAPGSKTITFQDLMRFRAIQAPVVSDDGTVVAYALQPDRGDGEGVVHVLASGKVYRVPRGGAPVISKTGRHVGMTVKLSFGDGEKPAKDRPKPGVAIVETATGTVVPIENAERLAFSDDGQWAAYLATPPEPKRDEKAAPASGTGKPADATARKPAAFLHLRNLQTGADQEVGPAVTYGFDPASRYVAWSVSTDDGNGNGLFVRGLAEAGAPVAIAQAPKGRYESLTWAREGSRLAFLAAVEKEKDKPGPATLWLWDGATRQGRAVAAPEQAPKGWTLPLKNDLTWARDGKRLFFGFKPAEPDAAAKPAVAKAEAVADPYDFDALLSKVELDVWHWKDPRIQTQQKIGWEREKDRTYRAVLHADSGKIVPLADLQVAEVAVPENERVAMGTSDAAYQRETTWGERYRDIYTVDLATGARTLAVSRLRDQASLSPDGRWIAYFENKQWHLYDVEKRTKRQIALDVTLFDEEHDTPDTPRAHGLGGWVDGGVSLLVYDAYDVWQVPVAGGAAVNLTGPAGRTEAVTFRVVPLDPDSRSLSSKEPLLLTAYHNKEKHWGFYTAAFGKPGVQKRLDEPRLFRFVAKARKADTILYTRQSYGEFPDVWVTDSSFAKPRKVSDANPQLADFAWGTAELVDYTSLDGVPLQGVLIKPANYEPGKRYPVITYFYERQSQRLHEFNEPVVNHRPSFAVYAGAGYAVFLPDIVFTVGHPGQSILKCLVPGVQKLVDMGLADPKRLGLHGHSWGGYGTAYLVTQTSMFAAAVTGAPVANMTSAYGGIRWESGVARQFQYEQTQSRIGGSLWEYPERYIENSALFYADRITTPLLIEHGDEDGAVPWYQAIELYLALRRLDRDCIFLQYRGEPHHLRKYPNKLDYSIKMKEYFDHYLKGEPAAAWITEGLPYRGK